MKILAVANQKGGVAKTTTAVNLASYIGNFGRQTLLIDLDPQANATSGLGINKEEVEKSIYDSIMGNETLDSVIVETPNLNVDLAPGNLALVGAEVELVSAQQRETKLKIAIQNVSIKQYDYVIIDTPPSLGLLTINALTACQSVLIPMQCEYYALEGLAQLYKTIQLVRRNANPLLSIEGLVFSMVDPRSNLTNQVMAEVKGFLKEKVYETVIPRNIRLAEAPGFGKSILAYDKTSRGAEAYEKLAREFLTRTEGVAPTEPAESQADQSEQSNSSPNESAAEPVTHPQKTISGMTIESSTPSDAESVPHEPATIPSESPVPQEPRTDNVSDVSPQESPMSNEPIPQPQESTPISSDSSSPDEPVAAPSSQEVPTS